MARPNSTLHDIATSIEEIHARLSNLIGVALDQGGQLSRVHVDRVMTLLQVMGPNLKELADVCDAAYALSSAEEKKGPRAGSFKEGAAACLAAMRRAETIAEHNPSGNYFQDRDEAMAEIMRAAGDMPHHSAGALAVLAEYFIGGCQFGQYNLACWEPEAMMTDEERAAHRESINAACD